MKQVLSFRLVRNLGLAILVGMVILVGISSLFTTRKNIDFVTEMLLREKPILAKISKLHVSVHEAHNHFFNFLIGREVDSVPVIDYLNTVLEGANELKELLPESDWVAIDRFTESIIVFKNAAIKISEEVAGSTSGQVVINVAIREEALFAAERMFSTIWSLNKEAETRIRNIHMGLIEENRKAQTAIKTFILFCIVCSLFIAFFMNQALARPIRLLMYGVERFANGDLTHHINIQAKDEFAHLAKSFNTMAEDLTVSMEKEKELTLAAEEAADTEIKRAAELVSMNEKLTAVNEELMELKAEQERIVDVRTQELKQTQYQLIQSGKLAAIGQLGAGVAHELNNPLGGILGYTQYLIKKVNKPDFDTKDFEDCTQHLEAIEKAADRCRTIVENLLIFSRRTPDRLEQLNVNQVIEDTLAVLEHQLMIKKVELKKELFSGLKRIEGNNNQLQQVFTNMILNAQQAMPAGGSLTISTRLKDSQVEVSFTDTGCGIPPENMDKIFDPFFTTKEDWKGTGLGLSVSYEIIRNHNGQIEVDSQIGKGTTFVISLPVRNGSKKIG